MLFRAFKFNRRASMGDVEVVSSAASGGVHSLSGEDLSASACACNAEEATRGMEVGRDFGGVGESRKRGGLHGEAPSVDELATR